HLTFQTGPNAQINFHFHSGGFNMGNSTTTKTENQSITAGRDNINSPIQKGSNTASAAYQKVEAAPASGNIDIKALLVELAAVLAAVGDPDQKKTSRA